MKKAIVFFIIYILTEINSLSLYGVNLKQWEEILSFGARDEGNQAEQQLTRWLIDYANMQNIDVNRYDLTSAGSNTHSFGSNISFYFPGNKEEEMVFLIPQSHYDASLIFGLALSGYLNHIENLNYSVRVIFLSAEEAPHGMIADALGRKFTYPIGTRHLIRLGLINSQSYLFYYRIKNPTYHFSAGINQYLRSPVSLLNLIRRMRAVQSEFSLEIPQSNVIIRKINRSYSYPVDEYLAEEYAAISIDGLISEKKFTKDEIISWANSLAVITGEFIQYEVNIDIEKEFNYIILGNLIIREKLYLFLIILLFFIFLVIMTFWTKELRRQWFYLKSKSQFVWTLIPLVFMALFLSTFITYGLSLHRGEIEFWRYLPISFVIYKIIWTLFLSALLGHLFEGLHWGNYLKIHIVLGLTLGMLAFFIFSTLSIVYALPWLWFLFIFVLYVKIKQWYLRWALAVLAPLLIIIFAGDFFTQSSFEEIQFVLFNSIRGNAVLLLIFGPIFILLMSLFQYRRILYIDKMPSYLSLISYISIIIVFTIFLWNYQPYDNNHKKPLWLLFTKDGGRISNDNTFYARIWSVSKIGNIKITNKRNKDFISLSNVPSNVVDQIPTNIIDKDFNLDVQLEEIFNRTMTLITLSDLEEVLYVDVYVTGERNLGVVDSNVPLTIDDQQNIRILLGKNPPREIEIKLITNNPSGVQVQAKAIYSVLEDLTIENGNFNINQAYLSITNLKTHKELKI